MSTDVPTTCTDLIKRLEQERIWLDERGYGFPALYEAITFALTLIRMEAQKEPVDPA